jgi:hypothetical protein
MAYNAREDKPQSGVPRLQHQRCNRTCDYFDPKLLKYYHRQAA